MLEKSILYYIIVFYREKEKIILKEKEIENLKNELEITY
jgi:hypothetical protein